MFLLGRMVRFTDKRKKAYRHSYYVNNRIKALKAKKTNYEANARCRKSSEKAKYDVNSKKILYTQRKNYCLRSEQKKTAERIRYQSNPDKKKIDEQVRYQSEPDKKKLSEQTKYQLQPEKKKMVVRAKYHSQPAKKKMVERAKYHLQPEKKKTAEQVRYSLNPDKKKRLVHERYLIHSFEIKQSIRNKYMSNPTQKRKADQVHYMKNLHKRKSAMQKRYRKCCSKILLKKHSAYYGSVQSRRSRLLHQASQCILTAKIRLYNAHTKVKKACHYNLHEPTIETKEFYIKNMKRDICSKLSVKQKVMQSFKTSYKSLAQSIKPSKLVYAVLNISVRKVLNKVLQERKRTVGKFLECVRAVNALQLSGDNLGEKYHTPSSEPFFMIRVIA